jgi:hypothetical protein
MDRGDRLAARIVGIKDTPRQPDGHRSNQRQPRNCEYLPANPLYF